MSGAAEWAFRAAELARQGKYAQAEALFDQGLRQFPADARFANSAGNFHARRGNDARAVELFEQALRLSPDLGEAAINAAIVLLRLGRPRRAEEVLTRSEGGAGAAARYWVLRADAARALGDASAAEKHLHAALARDPGHLRAVKGLARLALERGEANAIEAHEAALARDPRDFDVMKGYAQALQAGGRQADAIAFAEALVEHFPSWTQGLSLLADLRWAAGGAADFTAHFERAARASPVPETYLEWASLLSGTDRPGEAAEVLARAETLWPEDARLRLERAIALGEAGEAERAEAIFEALGAPLDVAGRLAHARNDIRLGRPDRAGRELAALVAEGSADVAAWALLDLCWRLTGDERHEWLHGQAGLVRELELPLDGSQLAALRDCLRALHESAAEPIAQSVKQGTQTRGALFARAEPELAVLRRAIFAVLDEYRAGLPASDPEHPLLSRRDAPWSITGSWSVRFFGAGRHASHIHPRGLLSSACYFTVPAEVEQDGRPGWLELGRPPEGLAPALGPLFEIKPRPGMCALFPSTLFHGTRPLEAGERMTAAFDVTAEPG